MTDYGGPIPEVRHLDGESALIYTFRRLPGTDPAPVLSLPRGLATGIKTLRIKGRTTDSGIADQMDLKDYIRDVPDFPEPGILFKDITPLLGDVKAFDYTISRLVERYREADFDVIVPIESRGFLFGAPLAHALGKPIVPVRKPGKLPAATHSMEYKLEYGSSTMEIHVDGVGRGQKVLIMDDLLATGGTLAATARLVEMAGGVVSNIGVIIELTFLEGRKNLAGYDLYSMIQY